MKDSLNLHGLKHEDVRPEVIRFLENNWMSNEYIEIITGNSPKMREIALEVIKEYDLDFHVGFMGLNTGRIVVDME